MSNRPVHAEWLLATLSLLTTAAACSSSSPGTGQAATPQLDAEGDVTTVPEDASVDETPALADAPPTADAADASGPDPAALAACTAYGDNLCAKLQACSPFGLKVGFGEYETCRVRNRISCLAALAAPSTSGTATKRKACADSIAAISCLELYAVNFGAACVPSGGALAADSQCIDDGQCASTFCAVSAGANCGQCAPLSTVGGACRNGTCSRGFACKSGTCAAVVSSGAACDSTHTCAGSLSCYKGKCVAGTSSGSFCDSNESLAANCDVTQGYACNSFTSRCITLGTAAAGARCGIVGLGYDVCTKSARCSTSASTCVAAAADGAACDSKGAPCLFPAKCVSGTCALPDGAACK